MYHKLLHLLIIAFVITSLLSSPLPAQSALDSLRITALTPEANHTSVSPTTVVSVTFNMPIDPALFGNDALVLFGEKAGYIPGVVSTSDDSLSLLFAPDAPLMPGDRMTAILKRQDTSTVSLFQDGYVWEFDVAPGDGAADFAPSSFLLNLRLTSLASGDFNRDGRVDFAVTGSNGLQDMLKLIYITADGVAYGDSLNLPDRVRPIYVADVNNDSYPDFILLHRGREKYSVPPRVSICHLLPDGSLDLVETFTIDNTIAGRAEPRSAAINDFNGDGFLDLIVQMKQEINPKSAFVYLNDGTGRFFPGPSAVPWFDNVRNAESIFDRDLNGTGFIDVGIGHTSTSATLLLYLNDGRADFSKSSQKLVMGNRDLENAKSLDLTGDRRPDIVLADFLGNQLLVYDWIDTTDAADGMPDPLYADPPSIYTTVQNPNWLDYADVDNDQDLDLLISGSYQSEMEIRLNSGGTFTDILRLPIPSYPANFAVGDVNGDAALDIAVADTTGEITILYNNVAGYEPPAAPETIRPGDGDYVATALPEFEWLVPADANTQDSLHFRIRIATADGLESFYDSRVQPELFKPQPPLPQGSGSVIFVPPVYLTDGLVSWSVQAWDGMFWSDSSATSTFTIDTTVPVLHALSFPAADYAEKWFAVSDGSTITAQIEYTEANPDYAVLTTNGLGGPFHYQNLSPGSPATASLEFTPVPAADGEYPITVDLFDKVAQSDSIVGVVGVDGNPPVGTLAATPSDTSASLSFRVSWGGGDDGTGSGLSGEYRVQYRKDGGPWTLWIDKTTSTDSLFTGVHNSSYEFEVASFDNVGFVEAFTNSPETSVFVNKYANDKTAPPPPVNLRANGSNPSPWQKTSNFTVRWDLPQDDSGIHSSFWKLGSAPQSNSDYDGSGGPRGPAEVTVDRDGETPFYVWLSDSAGNVDYRNAGEVLLRRDSVLPVIHNVQITGSSSAPVIIDDVPWFNSREDKSFMIQVDYSEVNPETGVLTTDGLTDSLINTGNALPAGDNVSTLFSFSIQNPADRIYDLKASITDSAVNKSSRTTPMGLDGNPPQNSLASGPAISDTLDFVISWSAGDDGLGSGVARYDLYVSQNLGAWQLWMTADSAGSAVFSGQDGNRYSFESVAVDYLGHEEPRSADGETTVLVDLAANDKEPPPPPIDLMANGSRPKSPWTANADFEITWRKPDDLSGVVGSLWKLGSPPLANYDTTGSGPAEGSMIVTMPASGKKWLYLWLIDAKGNLDFHNADSVLLRFDNVPPRITETRFTNEGYRAGWYNPLRQDSARFQITYRELYASGLSLKSQDLNYDFSKTDIASGIGVTEEFVLDLGGRADQQSELVITLSDSAGNSGNAVDTLRLDSTPPVGATASSPAASGSTSFLVSWSPGTDAGVGVSDTFDVFVKMDEDGWQPWLTKFVGRSATFTEASDKHTFHFEAVGRDWLGNVEIRTYSYETSTYVDVALSDSIAPGPPTELVANGSNPSPWARNDLFEITWVPPSDPTGTPKAWYKLGSAPTSNSDTTGSHLGEPPLTVHASRQNGQYLYVWLEDGAGNVDFRNHASVLLRYDAQPPVIDSLTLDADYNNRWYNPTVVPYRAKLGVYFTERNPRVLHLVPSKLFSPDSLQLSAGTDSASFELNFEGMGDADVRLKVALLDSAGNMMEGAVLLSLDRTPPSNTIAQSPDTTKPGEFIVSWDTSEAVENGSGLSGVFDVRVQVDEGAWELWKKRYAGTSATFNGEEGHNYSFEVAAYDNVGNKEAFLGQAESTTWVVAEFVDTEPPAAPQNILVNGEENAPWSQESHFTLNWQQPDDPSGVAKAYYKFDAPPQSREDYDGEAAGTPPIQIELDEEGIRPVYLWLEDGAGNSDYANHSMAVLKYDGTPPLIKQTLIANAIYNGRWLNPDSTGHAQIRITYDEMFIDSLLLFFAGSPANAEFTDITPGSDQQVDAILPLEGVADAEYPLAVVLQDSAGNRSLDSLFIGLDSTPPQGATASSPEQSITGKFTISWAGDGAGEDLGSGLSGEYDLRMRINTGPWFEVLNREKAFSYTYVGTHGNRFDFEVAAWDNTGNRELFTGEPETSTLVDTAFVDGTPPEAPLELVVAGRNPSPWQNSPEFKLKWQNPVDPSGIEAAFYKLGAPPTSDQDFTDSLLVESQTAEATVKVTQSDGQMLHLWLMDGRGNRSFENRATILLRYDDEAPELLSIAPAEPAFADNWYNQVTTPEIGFDVLYAEKHPDSLVIANGTLTFVEKNLKSSNGEDTLRAWIDMADAPDGTYPFAITLFDSAGSASLPDTVTISLDSTPPHVTTSPVDSIVEENASVTITATANDANPLQSVDLVYWPGGQRQHLAIPMEPLADSTFVADIPGVDVTPRGVDYLIVASDGINLNRYPLTPENSQPLSLRVRVRGANNQGLVMPQPLPHGTEENAYRLISFPLEMEKKSPDDLLKAVFGAYDIKIWRFFYWNTTAAFFQEYPDIETLTNSAGYWIITSKENVRLHTGPGVSTSTTKPFVIVLKKGWNDIGMPYLFPVDWKDIITASAIDTQKVQGPHSYEGRWVYPFENNTLRPWSGYSIYSEEDDISLVIRALEAKPQLAKKQPFASRKDFVWAMNIKATSGQAIDDANLFGWMKSASLKWDYGLDFVEAPEIGAYVSVYFPHAEYERTAERYTTDFRAPQGGDVWEFEVATQNPERNIRLSFSPVASLPATLKLRLLDVEANVSVDLRSDSVYSFQMVHNQSLRQFKIFAGDEQFMQAHQDDLPEKPSQYELVQNYPNPFNSSTIISYQLEKGTDVNLAVYNLLAQKVKQLQSGWQEKGFYQIRWDARDDQDVALGTGVYILRLETPEFTSTRKMVYMR